MSGCAFWRLHEDVTRLEAMAFIGGHVTRVGDDGAPIVVAVSRTNPETVVDTFLLEHPGPYFFVVPPGTYRIAAFADLNRDAVYQPDTEPAAYHGPPAEMRVAPGAKLTGVDVTIGRAGVRLDVPVAVTHPEQRGTAELPAIQLGEVVTLDDPRFSAANGKLGLWQPLEFLFQVGGGFYFLQPFDATKIPVLFVHGAGGEPGYFRYLVEHLDRTKFQPWLLYYPSGLGLDMTARGAARWMTTLAARYPFRRIVIVAHSMGGPVARATINHMIERGDGGTIAAFVSISSPWNGHAGASYGADAPVVMPMWPDMVPGSPFLRSLFATPLPSRCPYYLLFSYRGRSLKADDANDGVVAVSSELALQAQLAATKVLGFPETHMSILESSDVSRTVNGILEAVER